MEDLQLVAGTGLRAWPGERSRLNMAASASGPELHTRCGGHSATSKLRLQAGQAAKIMESCHIGYSTQKSNAISGSPCNMQGAYRVGEGCQPQDS